MKYSWLIFLLVIVWQVIAGAAQKSAKKQQQARMTQAAQLRRQQAASGTRAPTTPGGQARGNLQAGPARADDLAARRRAQLDELRRRRAAGAGQTTPPKQASPNVGGTQASIGGPQPTTRTSRAATARPSRPTPQVGPTTTPHQIETLQASRADAHASEDRERRRRLAERRFKDQASAAADREERATQKVEEARRARATPAVEVEPVSRSDAQRQRARHLAARLGDRSTLRELFILKELLEPPLALRSPST